MATDFPRCIKQFANGSDGDPAGSGVTTWCGKPVAMGDFVFDGLNHAAIAKQADNSTQVCDECLGAAVAALRSMARVVQGK